MKLTKVLEPIVLPDDPASAPADSEYTLKEAVVYQDSPTHGWAAQVCAWWRRRLGDEGFRNDWWPIDLLGNPDVLAEAVRAASAADVILVSLNAAEQLPLALYAWIDAWLPRRQARAGALVALIGVPDGASSQASRTRNFLQAIARRGGLDFLPHEQPMPGKAPRVHFESLSERANTTTRVLHDILDEGRMAFRYWGINE